MSSSYRMELDRWLSQLVVEADMVLDVGGAQLPVKGRTKSWNVADCLILDLPEPHADSPKPDLEFNLERDDWGEDRELADIVFCLEVFDYIVLPDVALQNLAEMVKPGGTIYATFPFIYPTHQPLEAEGLRYTASSIARLAQLVGLEVVQMIARRPETNLLDQFYRAERMRAAKGYDHNVTGWIVELTK